MRERNMRLVYTGIAMVVLAAAFVRGRMASYLDRLEQGLTGAGFDGSLLVTRSGGGAMTFAKTLQQTRPYQTVFCNHWDLRCHR